MQAGDEIKEVEEALTSLLMREFSTERERKEGNREQGMKAGDESKDEVEDALLTSLLMFSMMTEARRLTTAERSRSARTISGTITARQPSSMAWPEEGGRGRGGGGGQQGRGGKQRVKRRG